MVQFQCFIQQIYKVPGSVFLGYFIDSPLISYFPIHGFYGCLSGTLVPVLLFVPALHQHPVIPFQKLFCELSSDLADPRFSSPD